MRDFMLIFKKEMSRVFLDKKMIFSLYIMPVFMMVFIYGLMGFMIKNLINDQESHVPTIMVEGAPASFEGFMEELDTDAYEITYVTSGDIKDEKQKIYDGELDLIISFPENFDTMIKEYEAYAKKENGIPDVKIYYNPSEDYSYNAKDSFENAVLKKYKQKLLDERFKGVDAATVFTINADKSEKTVLQDDSKATGKMLGSVIPYLITILLFAGATSLGVDMFAGEKERGTMTALLLSPIKRSGILYGKTAALVTLSAISAIVYCVSMVLAMPIMLIIMLVDAPDINAAMDAAMKASSQGQAVSVNGVENIVNQTGVSLHFSMGQVLMALAIVVTLVFVYVALVVLPGIFARNTKEGSTYLTPIYLIVIVTGMITIFGADAPPTYMYLIPLYGPVAALKNVFTGDITTVGFIFSVLSNLITGGILNVLSVRAFYNEKIMFNA